MKKLDIWGCVYILSLLGTIIGLDRMIFKHFQGEVTFCWFCETKPDWLGGITLLLFIFALVSFILIKKEEHRPEKATRDWRDKVRLVVANSCSGSILDILVVITFVAFMAWIPDSISDYVKGENYVLRPLVYMLGLALLIYGKPSGYKRHEKIKPEERKLLVTGLSNVTVRVKGDELSTNLMPVIMPLGDYKNIEKIKVLLSDTVLKDYKKIETDLKSYSGNTEKGNSQKQALETYAKALSGASLDLAKEHIKNLIRSFICIEYPDYEHKPLKIEFSNPVDYNDFNACNTECFYFLKNDMEHKFNDYQVVVNITPGTTPVGCALAINSIKGEREMISINQNNNNKIDVCEPNVSLIQMNGWIEEHDRNI